MSFDFLMGKKDMDRYLNELAKELRKSEGRNAHFEIVIAGGASIVQNYTFRQMSSDIDAMINDRAIREAARRVADRFSIPDDWLNSDFTHTKSYTPALRGFSKYYRTFCHILEVRTIEQEYLIAMKLVSGRLYKHDLSDIIGILSESHQRGTAISEEMIDVAMGNLYGGWSKVDETIKELFNDIMLQYVDNPELYLSMQNDEQTAKNTLKYIESKYKDVVKEDSVKEILKNNRMTKDIFQISGKTDAEHAFLQSIDDMISDTQELAPTEDSHISK